MNEEHRSLLRKLVANARAIISYQVGLPTGCTKMRKLLYWLKQYEEVDFSTFADYEKETIAIPTGTERLNCSRDALRRYDEKLVAINLKYREEILDACFEIIEKYSESKDS